MQGVLHPRLRDRFLGFFPSEILGAQLTSVKLPVFNTSCLVRRDSTIWLPTNVAHEVHFTFEDDLAGRVLDALFNSSALALDSVKLGLMDGADTVVRGFWFNNPETTSIELEEFSYSPGIKHTSGELTNQETGEKVAVALNSSQDDRRSLVHVKVHFKSTRFLNRSYSMQEFKDL